MDCGFVTLSSQAEFAVTPLVHDRLLAVLNQKNRLCQRSNLTPVDLLEQTFILLAEGAKYDIGKLFARAGVLPGRKLEINDDYAAVAMVRQGLGVTVLPELMVKYLPMEGLCAIPMRDSERVIGIAVNQVRCLSPAVKAFLSLVEACLCTESAKQD